MRRLETAAYLYPLRLLLHQSWNSPRRRLSRSMMVTRISALVDVVRWKVIVSLAEEPGLVDGQVVISKEVVAVVAVQTRPGVRLGQRPFPRWTTTGRQEVVVVISVQCGSFGY